MGSGASTLEPFAFSLFVQSRYRNALHALRNGSEIEPSEKIFRNDLSIRKRNLRTYRLFGYELLFQSI